jgi:hypothetical protein
MGEMLARFAERGQLTHGGRWVDVMDVMKSHRRGRHSTPSPVDRVIVDEWLRRDAWSREGRGTDCGAARGRAGGRCLGG